MGRTRIFARIVFFLFLGFVAFDRTENIWVKAAVFAAVFILIMLEFIPIDNKGHSE